MVKMQMIKIYHVDVMSLYFFTMSNLLCQDPRWMEAKSRKRREPANLQPSQLPDVAQLLQANSAQFKVDIHYLYLNIYKHANIYKL